MKKLILFSIACLLSTFVIAQSKVNSLNSKSSAKQSIYNAISIGDVKVLKQYMSENVTIEIKGIEKVYAKNQATQVLQSFFDENKPNNFELKHGGRAAKMGSKFNIGMLRTNQGAYRVTYLMKDDATQEEIRKIKIVKVVQ